MVKHPISFIAPESCDFSNGRIASVSAQIALIHTRHIDSVFRSAVLKVCGNWPRNETLRKCGHIVIEHNGTYHLTWKTKGRGQPKTIATVKPPQFSANYTINSFR